MLNIENRKRSRISDNFAIAPIAFLDSPEPRQSRSAVRPRRHRRRRRIARRHGRAWRALGTRRSRRKSQPHPSRRDKCNFYFRLRTRPSRLVLSTLFSVGVHAPFKCRSSNISPRPTFCPANDRHLRSAVLYHPRDLFCLSYVHPESQHIRPLCRCNQGFRR